MIVEGIVTSQNADGLINVAPMGPIVHGDFESLTLRPFQTSTTFRNLNKTCCGVFHVVDSVVLLARAAVGALQTDPETTPALEVNGRVLKDCCRWFEFRISDCDLSDARTILQAEIVARGEVRPFFGFNRARHAVLEAAILATRVHLLDQEDIQAQMGVLKSAVEKTGGVAERDSFAMLEEYISSSADSRHESH